ncbi:MAG: hypothetical protein IT374_09670 [Polyangiaceae bacterium]|nr:hypothetical protein [Polyangiaceae bacterium]
MTDDARARLVALLDGVALPLARGGALSPTRPIGAALASRLADAIAVLSPEELSSLRRARGDLLRRLYPIDGDPAPGRGSLLLLCALNDLLQCVNPSLGARRATRLACEVERALAAVGPPETLAEALCRHATLTGLERLVRHDTEIAWWSGHARVLGRPAPPRLRAWPRVRRVRETVTAARLADLAAGSPLPPDRFTALLRALVACSPLTEAQLAHVVAPRPTALHAALLANPVGATLLARVLERAGEEARLAWRAGRPGDAARSGQAQLTEHTLRPATHAPPGVTRCA